VDRAIAQAVSHWFLTAVARVRVLFESSEICGGQNATVVGFLRGLRFPLTIIPSTILHSSSPSKAGIVG
jgi:hypothetical protein